jgi:hypothetical protein
MGSTPIYDLRWPELTDAADAPLDFQNLAGDVEAALLGLIAQGGVLNDVPIYDGTKFVPGKLGLASLSATGPRDASHYLRGDNTFAAIAATGYGTMLPGSPVDGQEFILVDSLTNPTYQWRFRYNAGSTSAYKWEFIGGTELRAIADATMAALTHAAANTYYDLPTPVSVVVPRAGEYVIVFGSRRAIPGGNYDLHLAPKIGAAAASDNDSIEYGQTSQTYHSQKGESALKTLTAGTTIALQSESGTAGGPATYAGAYLALRPWRVS